MAMSDLLGAAAFSSFGLWWVIAPNSVIRFYSWFLAAAIKRVPRGWPPRPTAIRVAGALWMILVVTTTFFTLHSWSR
jgi:hypothetical protein